MDKIRVRLLISDTAGIMFSDFEIELFLEMERNNFYGAASLACYAIAADKAKLGKFTLEGYADSEVGAANLLLKLASEYQQKALELSMLEESSWAAVEWPATDFARRRRSL